MRRSVKSVLKFLLLAALTVATTVVMFRYLRNMDRLSSPLVDTKGAMPVAPEEPQRLVVAQPQVSLMHDYS